MSDELFRLVSRPLSEDDRVWLGLFDAGEQYWECEVTDFLQDQALLQWRAGYSTTTLYSLPETPELIVGFITAAVGDWTTKKVKKAFPEWDEAIAELPDAVPVLLIPYLGVAKKYQGQEFGSEILTRFFEDVSTAPGAPRFIYLQCWEDNQGAIRFYESFGFEVFDVRGEEERPYAGEPANLLYMAHDRFRLPQA